MNLNGKPFVPPTCPFRMGQVDVTTASFDLFILESLPDCNGHVTAEIFAFFAAKEGERDIGEVATAELIVPAGSELLQLAYYIRSEAALMARLRQVILDRIQRCKWACEALDEEGLTVALRSVVG